MVNKNWATFIAICWWDDHSEDVGLGGGRGKERKRFDNGNMEEERYSVLYLASFLCKYGAKQIQYLPLYKRSLKRGVLKGIPKKVV